MARDEEAAAGEGTGLLSEANGRGVDARKAFEANSAEASKYVLSIDLNLDG